MRIQPAAMVASVGCMIVLAASIVNAQDAGTPDHPWQAQWIGTALERNRASNLTLDSASWIWADEPGVDPTAKTPAGTRVFSRQIDLPANAKITSAVAIFTADNHFTLIINNQSIGSGDNWAQAKEFDITSFLRPGANHVQVQARNDPDEGAINAAGLLGRIQIELEHHPAIDIVTDDKWKVSTDAASNGKPVRVIGRYGQAGPWQKITFGDTSAQTNRWFCLRKTFELQDKPKSAQARIAVDSKYWIWINGQLAVFEGGLKRGPNPNDTYFDRVDLGPYLQKGSNTIAVLACYWGRNGFSYKCSGKAGFVAEINADGRIIGTDDSWKAVRHPSYGATGGPHPNYRLQDDNVHFDARKDLIGWTQPGFDDSRWPAAVVLGNPPVAPWNKLIERPIPMWRVEPLREYENASELPKISDGQPIIARLPRNITVSPYLKIKAPAGLTIDMRSDNYKGGGEYNVRSEYVTRESEQEFESLPYVNGHWMIYSIPAGVEILSLAYRETRYNTDFVGHFECDDPFLNKLWIKCRNTMNVNMRDSIQDPDRERAQWFGDAVIIQGEIFHNCDLRGHAMLRKAYRNLVDWQKPDGVLFSPIPAGNWDKELPGQMLSSIGLHGLWYYYRYTGDEKLIAHAYPAVKRYLSLWKLGPDGLVIHRGGGWDWGDWGENIDRPVMDNALLYQALAAAIKMANLTGNDADIPGYQAMMKSIAAHYNGAFWKNDEYRSTGYTGKTDDRGHGLAVLYGLATPEQWPAIKKVFANSFESSPYIEKYLLESLFVMGDSDAALSRMKTRYRKMVDSEWTTLWEGWGVGTEGYGGGSYNHGWSGGPLTLMMQYVAGVAPTSPGFATFQVKPQLGPLKTVKAGFTTVKGDIRVEFTRANRKFTLKLTSPANTTASVCLPVTGEVEINGKPAKDVQGVKFKGRVGDRQVYEVRPGEWIFEATH